MTRCVESMYPVAARYRDAIVTSLRGTAALRFGDISPCVGRTWDECLTTLPDGRMALWFNDLSHSTHMVTDEQLRYEAVLRYARALPATMAIEQADSIYRDLQDARREM